MITTALLGLALAWRFAKSPWLRPISAGMILSLLLALPALPALAAPDFTPFGFELLRRVEGKNANAVISPYSVSTALAMTSAGARGATLDEMLGTLHLGKNPHPGMSELRKQLDTKALFESQLVTANRSWLQE
ncbi:hypothetical protein OY671_011290, partial [Metschnikowia pulcherrima]